MSAADDLYVLGINAYDHDVAACLLKNGEIVVDAEHPPHQSEPRSAAQQCPQREARI